MTMDTESKIYLSNPPKKLPQTYKSAGDALFTNLQKNSHRVMQIQAETGEKETYGQVLSKAVRAAIQIRNRGITRDDVICLSTNNHLNAVVPYLSGLFLGVKVASLDPILSLWDTTILLDQTKPKLLFVSENGLGVVEDAVTKLGLQCEIVTFNEKDEKHTRFSEFLKESEEENDFKPVEIESDKETAVIVFSSGTTGLPKGICLSHYTYLTVPMTILGSIIEPAEGSLVFSYPSTYWISTVNAIPYSIFSGIPRLLALEFDPKLFWIYVKKYRPSFTTVCPPLLLEVVKNYPGKEKADTSSLFVLTTGGAPVTVAQLKYIQGFFPTTVVIQSYGATEIGGFITTYSYDEGMFDQVEPKIGSVGKLFPGLTAKLVDVETDKPVTGPYQEGELRLKSDLVMNGYYNLDSSSAWDEEGFLRTGDVVYYDDDYFIYYAYRLKEILKYRIEHVQPAVLEDVLRQHPAVQSAIVIGMPHPEDGDHPMAIVILKDGVEATPEEILNFANERLDHHKQIRAGVKIVKEYPMTPTGKIKRLALKKMAIAGEL